jgi:hypothetical protein
MICTMRFVIDVPATQLMRAAVDKNTLPATQLCRLF